MSILIRGMEMPTSCETCILDHKFFKWLECRKHVTGDMIKDGMRSSSCPLVPAPPHGRLIDADALIERIEFEMRHYVVKDEFDKGRVAGWNNVLRAIREYAPTIIPAEEGE